LDDGGVLGVEESHQLLVSRSLVSVALNKKNKKTKQKTKKNDR
jgi:hypothetical protein